MTSAACWASSRAWPSTWAPSLTGELVASLSCRTKVDHDRVIFSAIEGLGWQCYYFYYYDELSHRADQTFQAKRSAGSSAGRRGRAQLQGEGSQPTCAQAGRQVGRLKLRGRGALHFLASIRSMTKEKKKRCTITPTGYRFCYRVLFACNVYCAPLLYREQPFRSEKKVSCGSKLCLCSLETSCVCLHNVKGSTLF